MEFEKVIRDRMAIRKFSNKKISDEIINKILEAGRVAPPAKNLQPIKIYVVSSDEGLRKIDNASRCRYNAPVSLLVCGNVEEAFSRGEHSTYVIDSCIVATHMLLEATNVGVDSIWIDLFDENVLREEFNIPDKLVPVALIMLGYRSDDCPYSANHDKRKKLDEIVQYI